MKNLEASGSGIIKFSGITPLNNGDYLVTYLVQHISDRGKKSHFTVKQFCKEEITPFGKDTEIEFKGTFTENSYKDSKGEYKTNGLEIIAVEIINAEVFQ